jgi:serine/threonine-protein kinase HipA
VAEDDGHGGLLGAGSTPSTHILKPPAQEDLEAFDINEHFCSRLARELGLEVAASTVQTFAGEQALVVERYDRRRTDGGRILRIHQEDTCQALAVSPFRKYENDGGPGAPDVIALLVRECDDPGGDVGAFVDTLALHWVICGTDAHAKNYSLLLTPGSVRLAPFYDLISVLPYPRWVDYKEAKLAMRIDREYRLWKIRRRHWEGLAVRSDLDPEPLVERMRELLAAVPAAVARTAEGVRNEGLGNDLVDSLESQVLDHSIRCLQILEDSRRN